MEARAQIRYGEERPERAKREREEHFALAPEEKKLEIAIGKRVKTKFLALQISNFKGLD